ncbi:MAG: tetratricopeptide repeat protein [bacterium]|nr:tetratricopeptide repeat protein [bacterium]
MIKRLFYLLLTTYYLFLLGCGQKLGIRKDAYQENQRALFIFNRAEAFRKNGDYESAIVEFRNYLDEYGDIYYGDEALFKIANCFEELGQIEQAILSYSTILKRYKHSAIIPEVLFRIGDCYKRQGEWKESIKTYLEIIKRYYWTEWGEKGKEETDRLLEEHKKSKWADKMKKRIEKLVERMEKK